MTTQIWYYLIAIYYQFIRWFTPKFIRKWYFQRDLDNESSTANYNGMVLDNSVEDNLRKFYRL